MILINLLPPELRKRHGGISPAFASIVVGGIVNVLLLLTWLFLIFIREPAADREYAAREKELKEKTDLAKKVQEDQKKVQEFLDRKNKLDSLINSKMYWARTLDEFANRLTGSWPGFDVRTTDLNIKETAEPGSKAKGPKSGDIVVNFTFRWKYKLLGAGPIDKSGDYIKAFFKTLEKDPFWKNNGFVGKPEETFHGYQPKWNEDIKRVIIENSLEWRRVKVVAQAKTTPAVDPKAAKTPPAKAGAK